MVKPPPDGGRQREGNDRRGRGVPPVPLRLRPPFYSRRMTSVEIFLIALGVGAALIAFWIVARFPDRGPQDFKAAIVHVFAALAIGWFSPAAFGYVISFGKVAAMPAIFGILLPVLVYSFLSVAWFLKLAHGAISHREV